MTKEIRLIIIHYVPQLLGFLCLLIPMAVTGNIGIEFIALSFFFSGWEYEHSVESHDRFPQNTI